MKKNTAGCWLLAAWPARQGHSSTVSRPLANFLHHAFIVGLVKHLSVYGMQLSVNDISAISFWPQKMNAVQCVIFKIRRHSMNFNCHHNHCNEMHSFWELNSAQKVSHFFIFWKVTQWSHFYLIYGMTIVLSTWFKHATDVPDCWYYSVAGSDMNTLLTIIDSLWEGK